MRLIEIEHHQCGEHQDSMFVLVDDELDDTAVRERAQAAQAAYLAHLEGLGPIPEEFRVGYSPEYAKFPDKTVAEVQALFAERKAAAKVYADWRAQEARSYADFLLEQPGFHRVDADPAGSVHIGWGHRHGQNIRYTREVIRRDD